MTSEEEEDSEEEGEYEEEEAKPKKKGPEKAAKLLAETDVELEAQGALKAALKEKKEKASPRMVRSQFEAQP